MLTLKAGTIVYHGTSNDDLQDDLNGPAWLSQSKPVAAYFAMREPGWGGAKRILTYRLTEDVELPDLHSKQELEDFAEEHGIELGCPESICDSISSSGQPGWIIPNNYPNGDDILLVNTSVLQLVGEENCEDDKAPLWPRVEAIQETLREEQRIKINTDYAVTVKYGQVHVLCASVYEDSIREAFQAGRVAITSLHTYN